MNMFVPATGTPEEWNAAYYRLEDYLRAHLVTNKVHQSQIILRLLHRAAVRHAQTPDQSPLRLALEEAYAEMDQWFQLLISDPEIPLPLASAMGRVSMHLLDAAARWPNLFLAPEQSVPEDFRVAIQQLSVQSGPDLAVSSMVPRPLDPAPEPEPLEEAWERLGRVSIALLLGIGSLLIAASIYYFTR